MRDDPFPALTDTGVRFQPKDLPLRRDVGWLGQLLGKLLADLGAPELFPTVETSRRLARRRRRGDDDAAQRLRAILDELEPDEAFELVRAFSAYFGLVNMAERVHRIRRRVDRLRTGGAQPGGLRSVLGSLAESGVSAADARAAIEGLRVEPVLTAHPTEAVRRTLLRKEQRIARALVERFHDATWTPEEREKNEERVRLEIATGWQTEEQLGAKPTVGEEVEHVLFYLSDVVYRIVPALYDELERAFRDAFGEALGLERTVVRFGSWVGGDMDGNPAVGAETIRATLDRQLEIVVGRYRVEVAEMFDHLSQSRSRVTTSAALDELVERDRRDFPGAFERLPRRYAEMPYRLALQGIHARLGATESGAEGAYGSPREFADDLGTLAESLRENRGERAGLDLVARLQRRLATFGFHLAHLDCRQDAEVHRRVVGELLGDESFSDRSREERTAALEAALASPAPGPASSDEALRTLAVFEALASARRRHGPEAVGTFVISMAQGADDALAVLLLARTAGCVDADTGAVPLDVVPLLETVDDLRRGPEVLGALGASSAYREHVATRAMRQLVMLGYSDSNKDGGITASRWALQNGQAALLRAAGPLGLELAFFHGRGGSASRGGSKPRDAFLAAPAGAVGGFARATEQGEVIHDKFGLRGLALRTLELVSGAVIERSATGDTPPTPEPEWIDAMETMATASRAAYRAFVHDDPEFPELFRRMTPIDVIERLRIGSRPAKRRAMRGVEDLRAIPWVFAWTQARVILPGWFGVGAGLEAVETQHGIDVLRAMHAGWPFFAVFLSDVEMVLAKADMAIASRYAELAGDVGERMFPAIEEEFARTRDAILRVRGGVELLDAEPTLQRSIRLRNPYVDPMSLVQVDRLRRWRESDRSDAALERVLVETVRGIARGLRNTG